MAEADGLDEAIAAIRQDLSAAAERLMAAAEAGLVDVGRARDGDGDALSRIEAGWLGVLEACAFEDLIGQRLTGLRSACVPAPLGGAVETRDALLNGPAAPGLGLDQAQVDAWLAGGDG
ncbi:hypothetical protein [Brevundimonas naejangsanensis]|uniref:hypothetical protein n=1 Tax=Brevundimonas naejangsanensis TaxID=588932 RepID=UPI001F089612|nr:hypothetical protein [Brevundimonas naejangsanensis]